jgi:SRSO17 transposase
LDRGQGKRRKAAGIPEAVTFATKPETGLAMVAAALDASVPCAWVLGDKVDGRGKSLRVMLERHDKPYVLSIRGNERLVMGGFRTQTAEDLAAGLSSGEWRRLPEGRGIEGATPL